MSCSVEDTKADTAQVALCKFVVALRRQDTDRLKGEYGDNCCPAGPSYLRKRRRSRSDASVCPGSICAQGPSLGHHVRGRHIVGAL